MLRAITVKEAQINKLRKEIETADAIIIGAGAGLSTSAEFTYSGSRFHQYFAEQVLIKNGYSIRREIMDCFNVLSRAVKPSMTTGILSGAW